MNLLLLRLLSWLTNNVDWLQAIASIIVIAGLPIIFFRWVVSLPYRAKAKLYFDPKETYHRVFAVDIQKDTLWIHLMVKNESAFTDIKKALGFVSSVWQIIDKKKYVLPFFRAQLKLKWAHEVDDKPKDILRGGKKRLDICFAHENSKDLLFASRFYHSGTQRTLSQGEYIILINLTAENLPSSKSFLLHIFWNGNYLELKAKPYRRSPVEFFSGLTKKRLPQDVVDNDFIDRMTTRSPDDING